MLTKAAFIWSVQYYCEILLSFKIISILIHVKIVICNLPKNVFLKYNGIAEFSLAIAPVFGVTWSFKIILICWFCLFIFMETSTQESENLSWTHRCNEVFKLLEHNRSVQKPDSAAGVTLICALTHKHFLQTYSKAWQSDHFLTQLCEKCSQTNKSSSFHLNQWSSSCDWWATGGLLRI